MNTQLFWKKKQISEKLKIFCFSAQHGNFGVFSLFTELMLFLRCDIEKFQE